MRSEKAAAVGVVAVLDFAYVCEGPFLRKIDSVTRTRHARKNFRGGDHPAEIAQPSWDDR